MTQKLDRLKNAKVLIYSHDSFGLGHLRRCRAIAHSLVDAYKGISVLILSGSPIISQFDFKARVDFVRIPGVVKLHDGDYTSLALHIDIDETLAMRSSIIQHTAEIFSPDIFLVDKEPLGLRGEVTQTLRQLKLRGTVNVVGLRDVMDDEQALQAEWQRKDVLPGLNKLYDEIWVYGSESIVNPIQGIDLPKSTREKMHYLGYLKRQLPSNQLIEKAFEGQAYILITPGGGGDGEQMVDWVVRAYEKDSMKQLLPGLIVLGPFMSNEAQNQFQQRIETIAHLQAKTFDNQIEVLMSQAAGVVAMGGYNTFCEILSFDKKAILVPREVPRQEQRIRADFAVERNLVTMLNYTDVDNTDLMVAALKQLPLQPLPSEYGGQALLNGLENVNARVAQIVQR